MAKKIVFCGCGGLYNYSLGIAFIIQQIMKRKNIDPKNIEFVGISAGVFPAMLLSKNLDIEYLFYTFNKELIMFGYTQKNICQKIFIKQITLQFLFLK